MGDHRFFVSATTVSSFANVSGAYINLKHRTRWGGRVFDFRDYYLSTSIGGDVQRDQIQRYTGATVFAQFPFSRYYRVEGEVGFIDSSQDAYLGLDPQLGPMFARIDQQFATVEAAIVGDTTRYQFWGPFQGKRFRLSVNHGFDAGGDIDGDYNIYALDFRAYKQLTRRSLIAWRLSSLYNTGERESFIGFGGINELRGYDYREFFGSRIAWSNLEFRFPLIDEVRFPILSLRAVRGFFFLDVGGAWLGDDTWYDPELFTIRANVDAGGNATAIPFDAWDSENNRLQDVRGTYGFGLQFLFLGGLQFNWSWGNRLAYTRYVDVDPNPFVVQLEKTKGDSGGRRMDFYIVFDF
jgi:outer membrane protein assembly factor BamA